MRHWHPCDSQSIAFYRKNNGGMGIRVHDPLTDGWVAVILSKKEALSLARAMANYGMELVCPPDCCGEPMQAKRMRFEGMPMDLWVCGKCGDHKVRMI